MKLVKTITTKVVSIDYDENADCCFAAIQDTIPVPVYTGSGVEIQERNICYLEFSLISAGDINEGDTITIETYEHVEGDSTTLIDGGEYIFAENGIHNIITKVEHHSN